MGPCCGRLDFDQLCLTNGSGGRSNYLATSGRARELGPDISFVNNAPPYSEMTPVILHVYDVSNFKSVRIANKILRTFGTGAYHTAVEAYGMEWSYGAKSSGTGVFASPPGACDAHHYRKPIIVGYTMLTCAEVQSLVGDMIAEWQGRDYNLFRRNCTHFAAEFCLRLGAGPMPKWVLSLAPLGAQLDDVAAAGAAARGGNPEDSYKFRDLARGAVARRPGLCREPCHDPCG
mmetsp:Transcript_92072/g.204356  ORF Transcript_92072/g.204356 Transcript_92072/m.204356 type:complete len:232 (+) Transcript_92072:74-769(+)